MTSKHRPVRLAAPHVRKSPKKASTLTRRAVAKPRIISDIRHTPIITAPSKAFHSSVDSMNDHLKRVKQSAVISHFRPITPRLIDTSPTPAPEEAHTSIPPSTAIGNRAEAHVSRALKAATAHTAAKHPKPSKSRKSRAGAKITAGIAVTALLVGFVVYQSIPELSFGIAARRAGFEASLPEYTPAGFTRQRDFAYEAGRVVISFSNNTDSGRGYKIEQTPSTMTNLALKEKVSVATAGRFQSFSQDGLTIYISAHSASWLDNGILHTLRGEAGLSGTQIAAIAASM